MDVMIAPAVSNAPEKIGDAQKRARLQKILSIAMVIAVVALMMAFPAFADDKTTSDLQTNVQTGMESIWKLMRYLSYGVAIVYVAIAAYKLVLGGQRGMETAKGDILKMIFFLALILLAPYVIKTVMGWFGTDIGFGDNPLSKTS